MSHCVNYSSYDEKVNKKSVWAEWNDIAERNGDCGGLDKDIRWMEYVVCENYEDAQNYIENHESGWYDQLAVKYKVYNKVNSKKLEDLTEKLKETRQALNELEHKVHYKGVKSAFISCSCCGSKLASKYFGESIKNHCPICRTDLRPQTTLDNISRLSNKVKELEAKYKEEEKKLQAKTKYKLNWLVKTEYHC